MNKNLSKTMALALSGILAAGMLTGCGSSDKIDGSKTVATMDGTEIPMGELSLMVRRSQSQMESMYKSLYSAYGMTYSGIWDGSYDEESSQTYGDYSVQTCLTELETLYACESKASDYDVALTAEEESAIKDAAAEFMAANSQETIDALGVTEEQAAHYLTLETIHYKVEAAIKAGADKEVSDDEANQTTFTYISITKDADTTEADATEADATEADATEADAAAEDTAAEDTAAEDAAAEDTAAADAAAEDATAEDTAAADATAEDAAAEDTAAEDAAAEDTAAADATAEDAAAEDTVAEDAAAEDAAAEDATAEDTAEADTVTMTALEKAQALQEAMLKDPSQDMNEVVSSIDDTLYESTGNFTTVKPEDEAESSSYPEELLDALRELSDGEMLPEILETSDSYYVARVDVVNDPDASQTQRETIITTRENDLYSETTQGWLDAAEIKVDDKVLARLKVTDSHTFTAVQAESTDETAEVDTTEADASEEVITDESIEDAEVIEEDSMSAVTEENTAADTTTEDTAADTTTADAAADAAATAADAAATAADAAADAAATAADAAATAEDAAATTADTAEEPAAEVTPTKAP